VAQGVGADIKPWYQKKKRKESLALNFPSSCFSLSSAGITDL
jgi:hypothetical protein